MTFGKVKYWNLDNLLKEDVKQNQRRKINGDWLEGHNLRR
jgi:hypothetical protein